MFVWLSLQSSAWHKPKKSYLLEKSVCWCSQCSRVLYLDLHVNAGGLPVSICHVLFIKVRGHLWMVSKYIFSKWRHGKHLLFKFRWNKFIILCSSAIIPGLISKPLGVIITQAITSNATSKSCCVEYNTHTHTAEIQLLCELIWCWLIAPIRTHYMTNPTIMCSFSCNLSLSQGQRTDSVTSAGSQHL